MINEAVLIEWPSGDTSFGVIVNIRKDYVVVKWSDARGFSRVRPEAIQAMLDTARKYLAYSD